MRQGSLPAGRQFLPGGRKTRAGLYPPVAFPALTGYRPGPMTTNPLPPDAFQTALQHQQAGRLQEAAAIYQALLQREPNHPGLLNQIALLHHQAGQPVEGLKYLRRAVQLAPEHAPFHTNAASLLLAAGQPAEAAMAARKALALKPDTPEAANNLGLAEAMLGHAAEAEKAFRQALGLRPGFVDARFNLANLLREQNKLTAAIAEYRTILQAAPQFAAAQVNLGVCLDMAGDLDGAAQAYRAALDAEPGLPPAHRNLALLNLAQVLQKQNRFQDAAAAFRAVLKQDDKLFAAQMGLGQCARELGDTEEALAAFQRAVQLAPDNEEARAALSGLLSRLIPGWHLPMLADTARNEAFAAALQKAVRPNMTVLDIGTGSGLLALLAARAGAEKVIACEAHPLIAATAKEIVAKNGYEKTITVIAKRSTELDPVQDMPQQADLMVAEILDAGLIGEGMLPTTRDALRRLVKPGAPVIPAAAQVIAQVVSLPHLRAVNPVREICGFDLSAFDKFRNQSTHGNVRLDHEPYQALSEALPVLRIDFVQPPDWVQPQRMTWTAPIATEGQAQAVVFWFDLWLDDEIMLSTGPGGAMRHWGQAACWLPADQNVRAGDKLTFEVILADNYFDFRLAQAR